MPPVTVGAMVNQALVRVNDVTNTYPSTRGPMYRRVGVTQRKLFVRSARVNPDYYGAEVVVTLANGAADLTQLQQAPELIQRIAVENAGSSDYAVGTEVTVITMTDPDGDLAPRVTLRNQQLAQVNTDLSGVKTLRVWYSRLPAAMPATEDGTTLLELDQPWDGLLETDLSAWLVAKATALDPGIRDAAIKMFAAESTDLMSEYEAHLRTVAPTVQRFMSPLARPGSVI